VVVGQCAVGTVFVLCGGVAGCYEFGVCTLLWGGSKLHLCCLYFVVVW